MKGVHAAERREGANLLLELSSQSSCKTSIRKAKAPNNGRKERKG